MLEVSDLGCIRGDRRLFKGISFSLTPGSILQIQGPNGSGKTSLLRMICGLLPASEGTLRWQGTEIRELGDEYYDSVTYVGHRNGMKEELTALENLRISSGVSGRAISEQQARLALEKMGLKNRVSLPVRLLSEGQQRRTALARLLNSETSLWVLDEVLNALDKSAIVLIRSVIEAHLSAGGMAVVSTHQELEIQGGLFQRLELAS